jgi:hypothetical protein
MPYLSIITIIFKSIIKYSLDKRRISLNLSGLSKSLPEISLLLSMLQEVKEYGDEIELVKAISHATQIRLLTNERFLLNVHFFPTLSHDRSYDNHDIGNHSCTVRDTLIQLNEDFESNISYPLL